MTNEERLQQHLRDWIRAQPEFTAVKSFSEKDLKEAALCLEFTLLTAILQNRLNLLIREWKQAEKPLRLEGGSAMLFHRPPKDYEAVIPASPMGNVLGFQYVQAVGDSDRPGDLRFFRCMGVGRWMLLHFHELFASDNVAGPHVLLLSGTSWAGTSPGYHVQVRCPALT